MAGMKSVRVDLKNIVQNENSRVVYKEVDLTELMHSLKRNGLLQPVGLKALSDGKYEAIFGNRRIVAAKRLGWADIDAVVLPAATDNDRDFLNLEENIKRQNISVTEEGRIYLALTDSGLKPSEIAVRLGVNILRIENALDAVQHVPKDFAGKIVNRISGDKPKGTVSATAYMAISAVRKKEKLNRPQFRQLLDFAAQERVSVSHINSIAPLIKSGLSLKDAITQAETLDRIVIEVFIYKKDREKLERKHDANIVELAIRGLETMPELKLRRRPTAAGLVRYRNGFDPKMRRSDKST